MTATMAAILRCQAYKLLCCCCWWCSLWCFGCLHIARYLWADEIEKQFRTWNISVCRHRSALL